MAETPVQTDELIFYADQEHDGLRFVLPVLLFTAVAAAYFFLRWLFQVGFTDANRPPAAFLLTCIGALPLGFGLAMLGDRLLKSYWRSGREVVVRNGRLTLIRPRSPAVALDLALPINLTYWYFKLQGYPRGGRERHVATGWYCLCCRLQQDEAQLIVFAFVSPKERESLIEGHPFQAINPADVYDTSLTERYLRPPERPKLPAHIITGQDGRFWLAERARWTEGVELTREDFGQLLAIVDRHQ